jgi:hypothetical protein
MSRSGLPSPDGSTHTFVHDAIALSFFVACVAATLALVSSMCSACGGRKTKTAAASSLDSDKPSGEGSVSDGRKQEAGEEEEVVVTLSPELATHGPIAPVALPSSTSKRLMSVNLSKKLSMNIPDKLRLSRRERKEHKVESEDTLWKKGIILGEKCRIPGERDGEDSDAADELAAQSFRRSSYSRPISRSSSFAFGQQNDTPPRVSHS